MKKILLTFIALLSFVVSNAQIGYQVALLNTATGEPRANETVTCDIKLTNSEGKAVYVGTKTATSNDFGVVSLTVGDANTFKDMDWSKLPLYISVSVDGKLVGRTEVLTVPVAEHAKHYGTLTYENIGEKKVVSSYRFIPTSSSNNKAYTIEDTWIFNGRSVTVVIVNSKISQYGEYTGYVRIDGNSVFGVLTDSHLKMPFIGHYSPEDDTIYVTRYESAF